AARSGLAGAAGRAPCRRAGRRRCPGRCRRGRRFQSNNGIFVVRSDDGGMSWNQPVAVIENLYDGRHKGPYEIMPELGTDTFSTLPDGSPNPNHGNLYEVWAQYYPSGQFPGQPTATGGSQLLFAVSHDGGQTWQLQLKQPAGSPFPVTVIDTSKPRTVSPPRIWWTAGRHFVNDAQG